jgi:hypothetical protein
MGCNLSTGFPFIDTGRSDIGLSGNWISHENSAESHMIRLLRSPTTKY